MVKKVYIKSALPIINLSGSCYPNVLGIIFEWTNALISEPQLERKLPGAADMQSMEAIPVRDMCEIELPWSRTILYCMLIKTACVSVTDTST